MTEKNTSDEILEAFMAQSGPEKVGKGFLKSKLEALYALVVFLPFLLISFNSTLLNWVLFGYGILMILIFSVFIGIMKTVMMYLINPFDYVFFQFTNFITVVLLFSCQFYLLYLLDIGNYYGQISELNLIDFIYYSTVTISTLGYGDIVPLTRLAKMVVTAELLFGMWFLITVIPVAISLQAERGFHFGNARQNLFDKVNEGIKNGALVPGEVFYTKKGKGKVEKKPNQH